MTSKQNAIAAISGGLDSAACVLVARNLGFTVGEALFLDFLINNDKTLNNAKNVAKLVGVNLNTAKLIDEFKRTVRKFMTDELQKGNTPSACTQCNPKFKWHHISKFADLQNIHYVATGHYAQKVKLNGKYFVKKSVDIIKDQSYFLWNLTQNDLERTIFPLGNMCKNDVKILLENNNLKQIAQTKESMSLCFVPHGCSYNDFVINNLNPSKGDIVDQNHNIVGTHNGYQLYTAAQKRGLNLFPEFDTRNYRVVYTDATNNKVFVSDDAKDLLYDNIVITDFSCVDLNEIIDSKNIRLQVRGLGRNPQGYAKIKILNNNTIPKVIVQLEDPAWAIAAGQSAVFYSHDDRVLGGGIITDQS